MSTVVKESPITVQALITDKQCFKEALRTINAEYNTQKHVLTLQDGTTKQLQKTGNRLHYQYLKSSGEDMTWWEELKEKYASAEKEKQEALRRERERVELKRRELEELTTQTSAQIENRTKASETLELDNRRKLLEQEISDAEAASADAEAIVERILASKKELANNRTEDITKAAEKLKYKTTKVTHNPIKRKTRIRLTW